MTKEEIKVFIGNRIAAKRKAAGFTQLEMANYLGCSRVNYIYIESGKNAIQPLTIWEICCALKCTPNDLFPTVKKLKPVYRVVEKQVIVKKKIKIKKLTL